MSQLHSLHRRLDLPRTSRLDISDPSDLGLVPAYISFHETFFSLSLNRNMKVCLFWIFVAQGYTTHLVEKQKEQSCFEEKSSWCWGLKKTCYMKGPFTSDTMDPEFGEFQGLCKPLFLQTNEKQQRQRLRLIMNWPPYQAQLSSLFTISLIQHKYRVSPLISSS